MAVPTVISERDSAGRTRRILFGENDMKVAQAGVTDAKGVSNHLGTRLDKLYILDILRRMFLPAGYPNTVSPDYLQFVVKLKVTYQVLNALQAFCTSLTGLLSSRAILQGFGVGDPSATPTQAMLLTVLQDVFGRLITILSAYFIGSALYPEAKTYRLLADIFIDTAVILDTLSPLLNTFKFPRLRVGALCISAAFKSLCSISAGGAKAAIAIHFSTPVNGKGDVGDLNAKDTSKETVLSLLGMLFGTVLVPRLTTPWSTYAALFLLVCLHLIINYFGVKGLALRTLNRQRLSIVWMTYRATASTSSKPSTNNAAPQVTRVPSPATVSISERIFDLSGFGTVRDRITSKNLGICYIGSSLSELLVQHQQPLWIAARLLQIFQAERYLIWFDARCLNRGPHGDVDSIKDKTSATGIVIKRDVVSGGSLRVHISLKDNYTTRDQLKAWVHAVELCQSVSARTKGSPVDDLDAVDAIVTSYDTVQSHFSSFLDEMGSVGWDCMDCALMTGTPSVIISELGNGSELEDRKIR